MKKILISTILGLFSISLVSCMGRPSEYEDLSLLTTKELLKRNATRGAVDDARVELYNLLGTNSNNTRKKHFSNETNHYQYLDDTTMQMMKNLPLFNTGYRIIQREIFAIKSFHAL